MRLPIHKADHESGKAVQLLNPSAEMNAYIAQYYGYSLEELVAPIGENEVGDSVRHNGVYFKIKEARRSDDSTLPQGVWTHDLKAADWDVVEKTALEALSHTSKDLQLGVWLMESSIHRHGFSGIAPAAVIIQSLCQQYWDNLHPQMEDGDIEFRTNPINWINEKLTLQLRLIPITDANLDGAELSWDDWDQAQRIERIKQQQRDADIQYDGPTTEAFKQRLAATPKDFFIQLCEQIEDGCTAAQLLIDWFDQQCGDDSPSLSELTHLMQAVKHLISDELSRRGIKLSTTDSDGTPSDASGDSSENHQSGGGNGGHGGADNSSDGQLNSRADAFARLREAAEFLMRDDPHSPVPYMVYTACEWGEQSAPDLYKDLFLNKGGQLNIFEMMGLEINQQS